MVLLLHLKISILGPLIFTNASRSFLTKASQWSSSRTDVVRWFQFQTPKTEHQFPYEFDFCLYSLLRIIKMVWCSNYSWCPTQIPFTHWWIHPPPAFVGVNRLPGASSSRGLPLANRALYLKIPGKFQAPASYLSRSVPPVLGWRRVLKPRSLTLG